MTVDLIGTAIRWGHTICWRWLKLRSSQLSQVSFSDLTLRLSARRALALEHILKLRMYF